MSNVFASCPVPTHSRYCGTNCVGNWRGAPYQLSSRIAPNTSTVGALKLTRYQLCSSQSIRQIRRGPPSSCWVLTSDQACALSTMSSSSQLLSLSFFGAMIAKFDWIIPKQGLLWEPGVSQSQQVPWKRFISGRLLRTSSGPGLEINVGIMNSPLVLQITNPNCLTVLPSECVARKRVFGWFLTPPTLWHRPCARNFRSKVAERDPNPT